VLTSIAVSAGHAFEIGELLRETSGGPASASRSEIGLQHDAGIPYDVTG
jgi:hypothetical protein